MSHYQKKCVWLNGAPEIPTDFRAIEGFPFYCINRNGDVFACRGRGGLFVPWTRMADNWSHPDEPSKARLFVNLRRGRKSFPKPIHKLVLEAFVGPCPDGLEGCHNDGNPANNSDSNLRWDTHAANMEDRRNHGRDSIGAKNASAKLDDQSVVQIRQLHSSGMQQQHIAPLFSVTPECVGAICRRETWKHIPMPMDTFSKASALMERQGAE